MVVKTILPPSGDQEGRFAAAEITRLTALPSGFMTAISRLPENRCVVKTSWVPSGFQAGAESSPGAVVRRWKPVPSALTRQISAFPPMVHAKASWEPSGDHEGAD